MSSDRLKAFASSEQSHDENDNWDNNFEGDLVTIKAPRRTQEAESHELETIRPYKVKPTVITQPRKPSIGAKTSSKPSSRKASKVDAPRLIPPIKTSGEHKFILPARPAVMYREQSVEDYSDLCIENDSVFDKRLNLMKVSYLHTYYLRESFTDRTNLRVTLSHRNSSIHLTLRAYPAQLNHLLLLMGV